MQIVFDEDELARHSEVSRKYVYPFSNYFGVTLHHYREIHRGLKPLRAFLLLKGNDFIFELETEGDILAAKKEYGNRMQFCIEFSDPRPLDFQILTTGSMDRALLVTGGKGSVELVIGDNERVISAKLKSHYAVKSKLRLDIDRNKLRIYVPEELIPQSAKHCWSKERADFHWDMSVTLALSPLEPIPTNLPDIYYMPLVYCVWYPTGRSAYHQVPAWMVSRTGEDSNKSTHENDSDSGKNK